MLSGDIAVDTITLNSPDAVLAINTTALTVGTLNVQAGRFSLHGGTLSNATISGGGPGGVFVEPFPRSRS
jgi:hypothetical protein